MDPINFGDVPVVILWCREEDYDALLAILEDADDLPKSWKHFAARMEMAEKAHQDSGKVVARININPRLFANWCAIHGKRITTETAYKFAAEIAIKEQRNAGRLR